MYAISTPLPCSGERGLGLSLDWRKKITTRQMRQESIVLCVRADSVPSTILLTWLDKKLSRSVSNDTD